MSMNAHKISKVTSLRLVVAIAALVAVAVPAASAQSASSPASAESKGKSFKTPEDAAAALYAAARTNNDAELLAILGSGGKQIVEWSDDANMREAERQQFADKYDQMHRLTKEPDRTVALYVGAENWPLPIPLVQHDGAWYFDAGLGMQEIRYRRIGRNEEEAIEVCHALIDAEKDYRAATNAYTAKFTSTGTSHDGLYWKSSSDPKKSPIGPYLAHAGIDGAGQHEPYHGYYYRVLLGAGSAKSGGFAILAYPAMYRSSGVMTFLMDDQGNPYEKDLGQNTADAAKQVTTPQPDSSWKKVD